MPKLPAIAKREAMLYGGLALLGVVAFYIVTRPGFAFGASRSIAGAAAGAVTNAAAGAVVGIGEAIGIPDTDTAKCDAAIAAGDMWAASFACPLSRYVNALRGHDPVQLRSQIGQDRIAEVLARGADAQVPPVF